MIKSVIDILKETKGPLKLDNTWAIEWEGSFYEEYRHDDRIDIENYDDGRIYQLTIPEDRNEMYKWAQSIVYGSPKAALSIIKKRYGRA